MELSNLPAFVSVVSPFSVCRRVLRIERVHVCPPSRAAERKLVSFPSGLVAGEEKILPRVKLVVAATEEEKRRDRSGELPEEEL